MDKPTFSPELIAELTVEGKSFMAQYVSAFCEDSDTFAQDVTRVFNKVRGLDWPLQRVMKAFAVMHGYLNIPYICGGPDEGDPEWAESRESAWRRWILYLRAVEGLDIVEAHHVASNVFYAVDEIAPYS